MVAEDDRGGLVGRKLAQGSEQLTTFRHRCRVFARAGTAEPSHKLAHLAHSLLPQVVVGDVDGNPVQPRLGRRLGFPRAPRLEGPDEGVMRAVLGLGTIAEDSIDRVENPIEARLVEAVEVFNRSCCVLRYGQLPYDGHAANILLSISKFLISR